MSVAARTLKMSLRSLPTALALVWAAAAFAEDAPKHGLVVYESEVSRLLPGVVGDTIAVSPDRRHVAFIANQEGKWLVFADGVAGKPYETLARIKPQYSPDSAHLAYVAQEGDAKLVVLDGAEGKEYENIGVLTFSPDGKRFAYVAQKDETWRVVLDWRRADRF